MAALNIRFIDAVFGCGGFCIFGRPALSDREGAAKPAGMGQIPPRIP